MNNVLFSPSQLESCFQQELNRIRAESSPTQSVLLQVMHVDPISPLGWLRSMNGQQKFYWRNRAQNVEVAGSGVANRFLSEKRQGFDALWNWIQQHPQSQQLFAIGGCNFFKALNKNSQWSPFGSFHFVTPEISIVRRDGSYMAIAAVPLNEQSCWQETRSLLEASCDNLPLSDSVSQKTVDELQLQSDADSQNTWFELVNRTLQRFRQEDLRKVVLAHEFPIRSSNQIDALALLERLHKNATRSYSFLFQPDPAHSFLSVSPERLLQLSDREIRCDAVAGTSPRGSTLQEDERLRSALLNDGKNQYEFEFVRSYLNTIFEEITESYDTQSFPKVLKLPHVQHLHTHFTGTLRPGMSLESLVERIHPTPAVGGTPSSTALQFISENEDFERGWYAAPIGLIEKDRAELAVGIRSARIENNKLYVYAGAGIVPESQPELEWKELKYKILGFLRAAGVEQSQRAQSTCSGRIAEPSLMPAD